jgi:hypothetical protein
LVLISKNGNSLIWGVVFVKVCGMWRGESFNLWVTISTDIRIKNNGEER